MSVDLLGFKIDNYSFDEAITKAKSLIDGDRVAQVITINPEMFQAAESDSYFENIIREAEMVIPDGVGVTLGLKLTGKSAERIPGVDFAKRLLQEAALSNIPVSIITGCLGSKTPIIKSIILIIKNAESPITMAAHFDGNEYTEDELEDIRNYAEFIKHKRNEAQQSKVTQLPDRSYLEPVAAHERTDISDDSRTDELKNLEASIMDNEDEWK